MSDPNEPGTYKSINNDEEKEEEEEKIITMILIVITLHDRLIQPLLDIDSIKEDFLTEN